MDILCGRWSNKLNGLSLCEIQNKKVLINNTEKRIVFSPAMAVEGEMSDEIAADPGQVICFADQNIARKYPERQSWVVVGYEMEIARWIDFYFYHPHQAPGLVDFVNGGLKIMGVPVGFDVISSYSMTTKAALRKELRNKDLSQEEQKVIDRLFLISMI